MRSRSARGFVLALAVAICLPPCPIVEADEGMWTFNNPPLRLLQDRYHFVATPEWLDNLRLSSVRFSDGGSGAFVSPTGLVLTNDHVARGQLQKLSDRANNYVSDGFYARSQAEELRTPDLELNVLVSMENVTARIRQAVLAAAMTDEPSSVAARRAEIAAIENESLRQTNLRSDVVSLYGGGEYWLYRYKQYTDVRLVFAPALQTPFSGGEPDKLGKSHYSLDITVFRIYENDQPITSTHYLTWSTSSVRENDLVFVSGHPARTNRLQTVAELKTRRDVILPTQIAARRGRLATLRRYAAGGPDQAEQAQSLIFNTENTIQGLAGELAALHDRTIFRKKETDEAALRAAAARQPALAGMVDAWTQVEQAENTRRSQLMPALYRTPNFAFAQSATLALNLVRYVAESTKPDTERLAGFRDGQLPSMRLRLFSAAPLYLQMDRELLADWLAEAARMLGADDPFIQAVMGDDTPGDRASAIVHSRIGDADFRKSLAEGGPTAVNQSADPMIVFARTVDRFSREMIDWTETNVDEIETAAQERIGQARFALSGNSASPDATFTLRLSFGTVLSTPTNAASQLSRAMTPLNFACTCDVTGGNSGSPVVDRNGVLVGVIYANVESLAGPYLYSESTNRALAVRTAVMIKALRNVYGAGALADELLH